MKKLVKYVMDGLFGSCRKACDTPDEFCYCPHNPLRQKEREELINTMREIMALECSGRELNRRILSELEMYYGEPSLEEILERNGISLLKVSRR